VERFDSGFEQPKAIPPRDDDPGHVTSTGSPSLDALVKAYARPKAAETRFVTRGKRTVLEVLRVCSNQEPCEEELRVQTRRGIHINDARAAAIEGRKAFTGGRLPLTRDEVAECVAAAFAACYPRSEPCPV
jgi:hypothetical protein